ncbi:MAG: hypothetical protein LBU50_02695, partial [Cellulomonas sp.]|nr:hypothetical protein [Cellulomonas sp.]
MRAGSDGGHPQVMRTVASRTYQSVGVPAELVLGEVRAAQAAGWELTGASCTGPTARSPGVTVASLKQSGGLDQAAAAWVSGEQEATGADQYADDTPGSLEPVKVTVRADVPHHLDQEWPDPPAVQVDDTCLAGAAPGVDAQQEPDSQVLADRIPGKRTKPKDQSVSRDGLLEAIRAASYDSTISDLDLDLHRGIVDENGTVAGAPRDWADPTTVPAATLTGTVDRATADGWSLAYTGCWASGMTLAELHRDLTGSYTMALRLEQIPSTTDPTQA